MRINNNMSAVITNNQLLGNEQSLSEVMEKLSSGFSINHASDNPSGIAIAGKMQAQIDGLDQASNNSNDGISVLQTAEGALKEVTDMIQRMRELSVQAANGTNSVSERETIQKEIDQLLGEIDRVSDTTQFNTINLLDGSLDNRTYAEHCSRIQTSDTVAAGEYDLVVNTAATFANLKATFGAVTTCVDTRLTYRSDVLNKKVETNCNIATDQSNFIDLINGSSWEEVTTKYKADGVTVDTSFTSSTGNGFPLTGSISINGYSVALAQGMSGEEVYEKLRNAAEKGGCRISEKNEPLSFSSVKYGTDAECVLEFENTSIAKALGFTNVDTEGMHIEDTESGMRLSAVGKNPDITLIVKGDVDAEGNPVKSQFGTTATVAYEDGNRVTISNTNGFEMSFLLDAGYQKDDAAGVDGKISFNVTDIGSMTLHIGANEHQEMDVRIRSINCKYMYIDDLDVTLVDGPEDAIDALDDALSYVTSIRASLGAYENRLEHTSNSLNETSENMTSAISRIEDADMASTMVEYTKYTVLQQAGTSALAQANELPQQALQLLQ